MRDHEYIYCKINSVTLMQTGAYVLVMAFSGNPKLIASHPVPPRPDRVRDGVDSRTQATPSVPPLPYGGDGVAVRVGCRGRKDQKLTDRVPGGPSAEADA